MCERGYGMLVGWLDRNGQLDPLAHPCDRVTRDLIRAFIIEYSVGRAEGTVAGAVRGIAYVLRACAPPDGVDWLTRLAHRMTNTAKPSRPKLPRMVRIADIVLLSNRLMDIGLDKLGQGHRSGAPIYRDGLIIGLLIHRPVRRRNLTDLRVGHNLIVNDLGIRITIPREETKKGVPFDGYVPKRLEQAVFTYLDRVRPVLLNSDIPDEGWLWIGRQGRRMPADDISIRVTKTTRKHFGRDLSPHLFRDCAATEVALERPELIGMTKHLLGHMTPASSQKFYNQATSLTAFSRHSDVIRKLREEGS
ncbi:integrase/recombinase XerC [Sphingobium wenxiniae]|uniref:Integrase/recombinase XerC n=2 Tax=Sphingobium wenxiniae (strain DSM 21828 / CGMCC 1.7748 / JZ-1) TaxID=595605 RepID=A0A562K9F1_SPHWJ|nr:integrase/recombinase XerC [Sphingobium wenxiniae]